MPNCFHIGQHLFLVEYCQALLGDRHTKRKKVSRTTELVLPVILDGGEVK